MKNSWLYAHMCDKYKEFWKSNNTMSNHLVKTAESLNLRPGLKTHDFQKFGLENAEFRYVCKKSAVY